MSAVSKGLLLDLDGVLVRSDRAHMEGYAGVFAGLGLPFDPAMYYKAGHGLSRREVFRHMAPSLQGQELEQAMLAKDDATRAWVAEHGPEVLPGAADVLARVAELGILTAIATNSASPEIFLDALFAHTQPVPVISRNDVSVGKPAPDVFLAAAEKLGLSPSACVVVEDSTAGLAAARAAGCATVIALTTTRTAAEFATADVVTSSLATVDWRAVHLPGLATP